jgi:hypothetical protein
MAKTAWTKSIFRPEALSGIYRNQCPRFSEITVRDLVKSMSGN